MRVPGLTDLLLTGAFAFASFGLLQMYGNKKIPYINVGQVSSCAGAFEKLPQVFRDYTLTKLQDCVTITGRVNFTHYFSPDGDAIFNITPDPQYMYLMSPNNSRFPFVNPAGVGVQGVGGYPKPGIHCEIACQTTPKLTKPYQGDYCKDRSIWPRLPRPKVGDHVRVTGPLVLDRKEFGGITEIHPVVDVQVIGTAGAALTSKCSTGWEVTGYFNAREIDYPSALTIINAKGAGPVSVSSAFLRHQNIEGMGLLRDGRYLAGQNKGDYEIVPFPQDGMEPPGRLRVGYSIAVDPKMIPFGTRVRIPTLPGVWGQYTYVAVDTGVFSGGGADIAGKHIDVFTGDGVPAENIANNVIGDSKNHTVCIY